MKQGQRRSPRTRCRSRCTRRRLVFVYNQNKIGGPLQDNTVKGPFFTMSEWVLK